MKQSTTASEDSRVAEGAMIACWQWRWRNKEIFRGEKLQLQQKIRLLLESQEEEEAAFKADSVLVGQRAGAFGPE